MGVYDRLAQNLSDEQVAEIVDGLGESDVDMNQHIRSFVNSEVVPHLIDRREAAQDANNEYYAKKLRNLDSDQQDEFFYDAVSDVVMALALTRARPDEGLLELKKLLRDPVTIESLLLIFDNPNHIDPDYSEQMKDFGRHHLKWVGAYFLPELYTTEELVEVRDTLGMDMDADLSHIDDEILRRDNDRQND